jgi:hypothetical protein
MPGAVEHGDPEAAFDVSGVVVPKRCRDDPEVWPLAIDGGTACPLGTVAADEKGYAVSHSGS